MWEELYIDGCSFVGFIPFYVFWSNEKNQLSFSGKMQIFYTESKQTGQLIIFRFWSL